VSVPTMLNATDAGGRRRLFLLGALAVLAIVYAAIATHVWIASWMPLAPIMRRFFFVRLMLGPFWVAVILAPITVVATALRFNLGLLLLTLLFYEIVINVEYLLMAPTNLMAMFSQMTMFGWNFILQLPVWGLTLLVLKLTRSGPGKMGAQGAGP
jgi:hypothetical protein